jgi:hypothetical protein
VSFLKNAEKIERPNNNRQKGEIMKPDENELKLALDEAERIRGTDEDGHCLGKSLLYLYQRNRELEQVFKHVEKYLKFGLPVEEHSALVKLVDEIREHTEKIDDSKGFGL